MAGKIKHHDSGASVGVYCGVKASPDSDYHGGGRFVSVKACGTCGGYWRRWVGYRKSECNGCRAKYNAKKRASLTEKNTANERRLAIEAHQARMRESESAI